jgi:hypothetical protein
VGPAEVFSKNAFGHDLVPDRQGNTTLVWTRSVSHPAVLAAQRPAGGEWGPWTVLGRGFGPQVAADARGVVTVAWRTLGRGIDVARQRPGGTWSAPAHLTPARKPGTAGRVLGLDLSVAPGGAAAVVWDATTAVKGAPRQVRWTHRARTAPWRAPSQITPAGHAQEPQEALDGQGDATLHYAVQRRGTPPAVVTRSHARGGEWTRPRTLGAEGYHRMLAVDRAGNALVVFTPNLRRVIAVRRPTGAPWGTRQALTPHGVHVDQFALAMNRAGRAILAWIRSDDAVEALRMTPNGSWSAPSTVAEPGNGFVAMVATSIDARADALVAWGYFGLDAAYQAAGGDSWSEAATIARHGDRVLEDVQLATGPGGSSVATYKEEDTALRARDVVPQP